MRTFKQMIQYDKSIITPKEDIYVNRQMYNWGQVDIRDVNFDTVTEVFDLVSNSYFYKTATPFQMVGGPTSTVFKRLDNDKNFDLETLFDNLVDRPDNIILFQIAYPNKYFHTGNILMILDKDEYESLSDDQKEFYLTINAYNKLVLKKCEKRTWKSISDAKSLDTNKWVAASKNIKLGSFKEEVDAAKAYDKYVLVVFGEHALTNKLIKYEDFIIL